MSVPTDLRVVLNGFFRHTRLFLFFFIPFNLAAILYLSLATPAYESTAKLLVKFGADARPEISAGSAASEGASSVDEQHELVESNVRILTSRDLAEQLLNDVSIATAYPTIESNPPKLGTVMDAAIKKLDKDLVVKTDADSSAITVGLFNPDPKVASAMLQHLVDLFITRQSEIYSNPQTAVLREQANDDYAKLQDASKRMEAYKEQAGIASIDQELNLLIQQRGDIAGYMSRRPLSGGMSSQAATSGGGMDVLPGRFPTSGGDRFPTLDDVQRKIDDLRAQEVTMAQTYRPDSEVMRNLHDTINTELSAQGGSVHALSEQIADLDQQIAAKDRDKARYEDLQREVDIDEEAYKAAEMRAQEAEAGQDMNQRKITQISQIETPTIAYKPSRPRTALILIFCFLAGTAFGLAACIIAENLDRSFSMPEQAEAELGVPVLASFVSIPRHERRLIQKHKLLGRAA